MAPLVPYWERPSHGEIQEVIENPEAFTSKSLSKVALPPFGLFAKMNFPPCTRASAPTYATVQMGRDAHLNLNSDLVFINHSCEPSLIFDMGSLSILAGPRGLKPGDELSFFYPSTEWSMDQPFDCFCGTASCRGRISGARDMSAPQLEGLWLNGYIRDMIAERDTKEAKAKANGNGNTASTTTTTTTVLREIKGNQLNGNGNNNNNLDGDSSAGGGGEGSGSEKNGSTAAALGALKAGAAAAGPSSRELSGEMGGDTNTRFVRLA